MTSPACHPRRGVCHQGLHIFVAQPAVVLVGHHRELRVAVPADALAYRADLLAVGPSADARLEVRRDVGSRSFSGQTELGRERKKPLTLPPAINGPENFEWSRSEWHPAQSAATS